MCAKIGEPQRIMKGEFELEKDLNERQRRGYAGGEIRTLTPYSLISIRFTGGFTLCPPYFGSALTGKLTGMALWP